MNRRTLLQLLAATTHNEIILNPAPVRKGTPSGVP